MLKIPRSLLFVWITIGLLLAACQPVEGDDLVKPSLSPPVETVLVTQIVTGEPQSTATPRVTPTPSPVPVADDPCCQDYHIAILGDPISLNPWAFWAEATSPWAAPIIEPQFPTLFTYPDLRSAERPDFVPALALDLPLPVEAHDDFWTVQVELLPDASWSDGEPITAQDVVFTAQTALEFRLGGTWSSFYPPETLDRVEADGQSTVVFYFNQLPNLRDWQFGAAMGPILPKHFWTEVVNEARALLNDQPPPSDCSFEASAASQDACLVYDQARELIYTAAAIGAPAGGAYVTTQYQPGRAIHLQANPNYYASGITIREYADGTWERQFPDGRFQTLYGQARAEQLLEYQQGPYSPQIHFQIYATYAEAETALLTGQVEYLLNPSRFGPYPGFALESSSNLNTLSNPKDALYYLAFNLRKPPYALPEFRQAVEILLEKEFLTGEVLQGAVLPADAFVPAANTFWSVSQTPASSALDRQSRLELAVTLLKTAGWTWRSDPTWDAEHLTVRPGRDPRLPGGELAPAVRVLSPALDYDPQSATINLWLAEWLRDLGLTVESELTTPEFIWEQIFIGGVDFDLYILGWEYSLYPDYVCDLFDSRQDTFVTGGFNTTGFNNPDLDLLCDRLQAATDFETAREQLTQIQTILLAERPYIPLFYPLVIDRVASQVELPYLNRVGGMVTAHAFQSEVRVLDP